MRPLVTHDKPYLSAQAWMGRALLALYRATGDSKWLGQAVTIADAMLTNLHDKEMADSTPPHPTQRQPLSRQENPWN